MVCCSINKGLVDNRLTKMVNEAGKDTTVQQQNTNVSGTKIHDIVSAVTAVLLTASICFMFLFIILGSISCGFFISRQDWGESICVVTSLKLDERTDCSPGHTATDCSTVYEVSWDIQYYNPVSSLVITSEINEDYNSKSKAYVAMYKWHSNNSYTCYFNANDFTVKWTMPYGNYKDIGYSALAFGIATIWCIVVVSAVQLASCAK